MDEEQGVSLPSLVSPDAADQHVSPGATVPLLAVVSPPTDRKRAIALPDARTWGREQAARSPEWSEAKWQRVGQILGLVYASGADNERAA